MSVKVKIYILIALVVILIAIGVYIYLSKKKKDANAAIILSAINQGVGVQGTDIDSLLFSVTAESGYNTPKADLQKLKDAHGTFIDSPDNFKEVFAGKSKARIKKVAQDFMATYGIKLNDYINEVFSDLTGFDTTRYNQLLNIIRSAA